MGSRGVFLFRGLHRIVHSPQYEGVWPGQRKDLLRETVPGWEMTQLLSSPGPARPDCAERGKKL